MKMKIKFLLKGVYIIGYTQYPTPEQAEENEIIIEDVSQEVLEEYMHYKVIDGALVRMSDEEYAEVHPEALPQPQEPTELDQTQQKITELELEIIETNQLLTEQELANMETNQHLTDLELIVLEGGVGNV